MVIKLIKILVNYIYKNVDYIFVQSKYFKKNILAFNNTYKKKLWVYENPSEDFSNFKLINKQKKQKTKIITYSGNLGHAQDLNVFIELAKKFRDNDDKLIIHIFGEGSLKK